MDGIELNDIRKMVEVCRGELGDLGLKTGEIASVSFNSRAKTLFGRCRRERSGTYHIEIMTYLNRHRTLDEIRQTVMHEVIHTLPACGNHGETFQKTARLVNERLGFRISTTSKLSKEAKEAVAFAYVLKCGYCGEELKRYHRKPRISPHHYHRPCGEESKGKLELYRYIYQGGTQ